MYDFVIKKATNMSLTSSLNLLRDVVSRKNMFPSIPYFGIKT